MNRKELICFETDASGIKGKVDSVFFPTKAEEIQEIIINSNKDIVPRGAGTNLVGGCVPDNSIIIDLSKMNRIYNFDRFKKTLYVEAGVTIKELNEKLKPQNLEFPIELSNEGISTIGGMIAMNSSGRRNMRYGSMKYWIEEVEIINGNGEIMKITKPDISDVCGMEGLTGIIINAKLKLISIPKRSASIFQSENLDEVLSVAKKLKQENEVCMLELFSKKLSKIFGYPEKYNLIIEFDSDLGKIKDEEYYSLIKSTGKVFYKLASEGYTINEDPKFFSDKIKDFILMLENNDIPYIAYFGTNIVHPFFKERDNKRGEIMNFLKKMNIKFGKYGIGLIRKDFLDPLDIRIIQRTKLRYDPQWKLNKKKVIDPIEDKIKTKEDFTNNKSLISKNLGSEPIVSQSDKTKLENNSINVINTDIIENSKTESKTEKKDSEIQNTALRNEKFLNKNNRREELDLIKKIMTNKYKETKKEDGN